MQRERLLTSSDKALRRDYRGLTPCATQALTACGGWTNVLFHFRTTARSSGDGGGPGSASAPVLLVFLSGVFRALLPLGDPKEDGFMNDPRHGFPLKSRVLVLCAFVAC
jgi:hypothetical protein